MDGEAGPGQQVPIRVQIGSNVLSVNDILCNPALVQQLSAQSQGTFVSAVNAAGQPTTGFLDLSPQKTNQVQLIQSANTGSPFGASFIPAMAPGTQVIATPVVGPGGTISYNLIPQCQNVLVINPENQEQNGFIQSLGTVQNQTQSNGSNNKPQQPSNIATIDSNSHKTQGPTVIKSQNTQVASELLLSERMIAMM